MGHSGQHQHRNVRDTMSDERIVDLDEVAPDCEDDAVVTLLMLTNLHGDTHRRWRVTPSAGGSWNYEKA
jgi:hypothetical protein